MHPKVGGSAVPQPHVIVQLSEDVIKVGKSENLTTELEEHLKRVNVTLDSTEWFFDADAKDRLPQSWKHRTIRTMKSGMLPRRRLSGTDGTNCVCSICLNSCR